MNDHSKDRDSDQSRRREAIGGGGGAAPAACQLGAADPASSESPLHAAPSTREHTITRHQQHHKDITATVTRCPWPPARREAPPTRSMSRRRPPHPPCRAPAAWRPAAGSAARWGRRSGAGMGQTGMSRLHYAGQGSTARERQQQHPTKTTRQSSAPPAGQRTHAGGGAGAASEDGGLAEVHARRLEHRLQLLPRLDPAEQRWVGGTSGVMGDGQAALVGAPASRPQHARHERPAAMPLPQPPACPHLPPSSTFANCRLREPGMCPDFSPTRGSAASPRHLRTEWRQRQDEQGD